ncbi:MAG: DMT family transporter [Muribaculaceae bacterium]|nr:DMT family transporter [Muribaculaceae bacterium]
MPSKKFSASSLLWCHIGAILAVSAWGVSFISTKILQADNGLTPTEVYLLRFSLAYLAILTVSHDRLWANSLRDEFLLFTGGLCGGSIYFMAENSSLQYTYVSNVALLTALAPLITALIVGLLYRSERPGVGLIIGSVMAFVGVSFVVFNSSGDPESAPSNQALGDTLAILSAVGWSIYTIVLRKVNALYTAWFISRKTFFYGLLTALPFLLTQDHVSSPTVLTKPEVWGNILFLGLFCSMGAYIIWAQTIKRLGPVKASNYLYLSPVVTLIASYIILGESISLIGTIGCVLILGGVWLGDELERRRKSKV